MNVFVQLLGWLLIALTFIGSYRLAAYLARPTQSVLYPILFAGTITAAFIIVVDTILLVTGLLTIFLPSLWILRKLGVHSYRPITATTHRVTRIGHGARTRLPGRSWITDRDMPRPGLSGPEDPQQHREDLADNASAAPDHVEQLLDRIERLRHGPQHSRDSATIEFDEDDHWEDD